MASPKLKIGPGTIIHTAPLLLKTGHYFNFVFTTKERNIIYPAAAAQEKGSSPDIERQGKGHIKCGATT